MEEKLIEMSQDNIKYHASLNQAANRTSKFEIHQLKRTRKYWKPKDITEIQSVSQMWHKIFFTMTDRAVEDGRIRTVRMDEFRIKTDSFEDIKHTQMLSRFKFSNTAVAL